MNFYSLGCTYKVYDNGLFLLNIHFLLFKQEGIRQAGSIHSRKTPGRFNQLKKDVRPGISTQERRQDGYNNSRKRPGRVFQLKEDARVGKINSRKTPGRVYQHKEDARVGSTYSSKTPGRVYQLKNDARPGISNKTPGSGIPSQGSKPDWPQAAVDLPGLYAGPFHR